ncbi:molybdenum cofactor guanylyltransferase [Altericroceibacterium xinjiangense]|uniref:molybdenum cofactor guanylyltransferase n=1 Tax=Altericroceibacterium xinjiangense TaxID=762261 RepID=UPI000F7F44B3|nr:molybdenum cofactor guanylyltransferase [Altericroceibacterium xinjiangense]
MILGVVLAGGQSSRFGSDKALAELGGQTLLARGVDALSGWCDFVIVAGRAQAPAPTVPDWPRPGMGPLGGLAAALRYAQDEDFASVLTCGVDSVGLPPNLLEMLSPAPAYLESQPVVGHWPVGAVSTVESILHGDGKHSMMALAEAISATPVKSAQKSVNINTLADLAAAEKNYGL